MERRYVTLQQMFFYAHELEDNLLVCGTLFGQIRNDEWNVVEHETMHEQEGVDLHPNPFQHEKKDEFSEIVFKVFNDDVFVEDKSHLVEEQVVVPIFLVMILHRFLIYLNMMSMMLIFYSKQLYVFHQEMILFIILVKSFSLYIFVMTWNMNKIVS